MTRGQDQIVRGIAGIVERTLSERVDVELLAKELGYSYSYLAALFKKHVGESILSYAIRLKIEKSKGLLISTKLSILEIAYDLGFGSPSRFAELFRKRVGMSPGAFRRAASKMTVASPKVVSTAAELDREWLCDGFDTELQPHWKPVFGRWLSGNGILTGEGAETSLLCFVRALPANFRITFEIALQRKIEILGDFRFHLQDDRNETDYCCFVIGAHNRRVCEMQGPGHAYQCSQVENGIPAGWCRAALEFKDNTITLVLNDFEVFQYRDPFPSFYASRCRFALDCWRSTVRVRDLRIHDLGFSPLVSVVEQGDQLYGLGLHERAREFYERLLRSMHPSADMMELQFKMGMCDLSLGRLEQAREGLQRIVTPPEKDVWARQARLALLEIALRLGDFASFSRSASDQRALFSKQHEIYGMVMRVAGEFASKGFCRRAIAAYQFLREYEDRDSIPQFMASQALSNALGQEGRSSEMAAVLEALLANAGIPEQIAIQSLLDLAFAYSALGRTPDAKTILDQARHHALDSYALAQLEIARGRLLRAERRSDEALAVLRAVPKAYADLSEHCVCGLLEAALILCGLQCPAEAEALLQKAEKLLPSSFYFRKGRRSRYQYPLGLVKGQFAKAAELLMEDSRFGSAGLFESADCAVKAGILLELSGNDEEARRTWLEVMRRFPADRVAVFGEIADRLLDRNGFPLPAGLPMDVHRQCELSYLTGLLLEKRGRKHRALEFFEFGLQIDRTLRWAACLSRLKVLELRTASSLRSERQ